MQNWWEPTSEAEAWYKIIGTETERPEETAANVEAILAGYTGKWDLALDVGCGIGRLMKQMSKRFEGVVGIDISKAMQFYSVEYLKDCPKSFVLQTDDGLYPVQASTFDFAYSYIAFQHMHTLDVVRTNIQSIFRALRPDGVCRIQTVKGKSYRSESDGNHAHLFEDQKDFLNLFLDAGFQATVEVGVTHFQHIWVTGRKPW